MAALEGNQVAFIRISLKGHVFLPYERPRTPSVCVIHFLVHWVHSFRRRIHKSGAGDEPHQYASRDLDAMRGQAHSECVVRA
jgi:hypothetical protein